MLTNEITLREYVETLVESHDQIHHAEHEAVKLQAVEYARRLEELNHAHERAIQDKQLFVTKAEMHARDERTGRLEVTVKDLELKLIGRSRYEADMTAVGVRFQPLERLASRATLLFPGGMLVGALVLYIVEKAIGG